MYICISNKAKHLKTQIMTTTMKLAIETYSNLTGQTFNSLVESL